MPLLFVGVGLLALPFVYWKAHVFTILWGWFVVPYFHLPPLSPWLVYGLITMYAMLKSETPKEDEPKTKWVAAYVGFIVSPAISLGIGWLIHHYALHGK